jgi:hypothetical protein
MNTNGLARHYDRLTPWERLPLMLAASARGDEAEKQRLARSAPKVSYRVPDYFALDMAFQEISDVAFMELLNLTALYFRMMGFAEAWDDEHGRRMHDCSLLCGYHIKVRLAAWRAFCAEFHFDPERSWSCLPGFDTIKDAERLTEWAAFTKEQAETHLRQRGKDAGIATEAEITAGLRACLKHRVDWWE